MLKYFILENESKLLEINNQNIVQILKSILDIDQELTGIEYLKEFIKNIAVNIGVKYVFLGHPTSDKLDEVQTDIVWANGNFVDNFSYELKDTPCENVFSGHRVCIHDKNVTKEFPKDILLQKMHIESYVGAPIVSNTSTHISNILVLLDEKPMHDVDFFTSITDFLAMRASAEINQHNVEKNLLQEVNNRTKELEEAKKKIEQINKTLEVKIKEEIAKNEKKQQILFQQSKMAALGEMLENIAHQWKQPLATINTTISGIKIQKEFDKLDETQLFSYLDMIENSASFMSQTIDDFRNFFDKNKIKQEFKVENCFEKTFKLTTSSFKNSQIELFKNIADISIFGLENELIQVLLNILSNAKDELLKIEQDKKLIFIETVLENDNLIILIKDNAGGIPNHIIDNIFDLYFTTKGNSGTGIGLYMSKMIIKDSFSGSLSVKNQEYIYENISYTGAEFKISLPLNQNLDS